MMSSVISYFLALCRNYRLREVRINKESVLITGCDSGIGLCFAKHLASLGCTVFAGVLDPKSEGAKQLLDFDAKGEIRIVHLDVKDEVKIKNCQREIEETINSKQLELTSVINNAGIMVFGEFEWQTDEQIMDQISVNLLGYMKITKTFLPLLHKFNGISQRRLINVSSHCALVPLPCLSVYSATKSAVEAWSSSLSLELHKFNIPVITLLPGSYAQQSNILKKHNVYKEEMWDKMNSNRKTFHKDNFDSVMNYMSAVYSPAPIDDPALLSTLRSALFSYKPKQTYINSPWRYTIYHKLINISGPFRNLKRLLILSFVTLPKYR